MRSSKNQHNLDDWRRLYKRPLSDLGDLGNERLRGIYSPNYDQSLVSRYVHAQFLEQAQKLCEEVPEHQLFSHADFRGT